MGIFKKKAKDMKLDFDVTFRRFSTTQKRRLKLVISIQSGREASLEKEAAPCFIL